MQLWLQKFIIDQFFRNDLIKILLFKNFCTNIKFRKIVLQDYDAKTKSQQESLSREIKDKKCFLKEEKRNFNWSKSITKLLPGKP